MILTTKSSKQRTRVLPKKQEVVISSVRVEIELAIIVIAVISTYREVYFA